MSTVVPMLPNRLSEAQYDAERENLRRLYGDSSAEAIAKRDQALAVLFARSGWTQEELAAKEGMGQTWVVQRLRFGRFLNFIAGAINAETLPIGLREKRFRRYWDQADDFGGNERQRFAAVAKAIHAEANAPTLPRERHDVGPLIVEAFADGKWHDERTVIDRFPDDDPEVVLNRLRSMRSVGIFNTRAEREKRGKGHRWRLFKQERQISTAEIKEKLLPLVEGLAQEGRKNMATMSPGTVARLAALLRRQIDDWEQ